MLAQIEADHLRYEGVDRFIVGDAGADGIRQHHASGAVHRQQPRHAQHRVGAKGQRVEIRIVDPPVYDVHAPRPLGGAHIHRPGFNKQIRALHQLNAHLLGQKAVFKIGAVKPPWGHHHHARVVHGRAFAQRLQQIAGVAFYRRNMVLFEHFGIQPHHHFAVFQHVGDAGGGAQIILQHVILAVAVAHHIDSGDMGVGVIG